MPRWFASSWWTWPWPHWLLYRLRLRVAWEHLPAERRAAYREAMQQIGAAGGFTYEEASRAITQLARASGKPIR